MVSIQGYCTLNGSLYTMMPVLTLCNNASQAATCKDYVANNPSAFVEAYWLVNSVKVYQLQVRRGSSHSSYPSSEATLGNKSSLSAGPDGMDRTSTYLLGLKFADSQAAINVYYTSNEALKLWIGRWVILDSAIQP